MTVFMDVGEFKTAYIYTRLFQFCYQRVYSTARCRAGWPNYYHKSIMYDDKSIGKCILEMLSCWSIPLLEFFVSAPYLLHT